MKLHVGESQQCRTSTVMIVYVTPCMFMSVPHMRSCKRLTAILTHGIYNMVDIE